MAVSRIIAQGMLRENTPVEDYTRQYGLFVKREDLSCLKPGPPFSKARGVYARVKSRPEKLIGVLDTSHSQAGHAVARACQILGKECVNFYPKYKADTELREPQLRAKELGARLVDLPAGRSCILYHAARKQIEALNGYIMPNALKLDESVTETAKECDKSLKPSLVIIPASSGTIAAGVIKGFGVGPKYLVHLGYSRSINEVERYLREQSGVSKADIQLVDEGYAYNNTARQGETPPWPCNVYYDLKAFRWWIRNQQSFNGMKTIFWNIG